VNQVVIEVGLSVEALPGEMQALADHLRKSLEEYAQGLDRVTEAEGTTINVMIEDEWQY
jgi:hypothetical protein